MTDYEKFETGEKPDAYSWSKEEEPTPKSTQTLERENETEAKIENMLNEVEGNLDVVKRDIESLGGPEKLDAKLNDNPALKGDIADKADRLFTAMEGLIAIGASAGLGAAIYSSPNGAYSAEAGLGLFLMGTVLGGYELLTAIRGKEWKPFHPKEA